MRRSEISERNSETTKKLRRKDRKREGKWVVAVEHEVEMSAEGERTKRGYYRSLS